MIGGGIRLGFYAARFVRSAKAGRLQFADASPVSRT
jgi:hypothetical protein